MKIALFMIASVLTAGGASWLALPAVQNEGPQVPTATAPVQCHGTAETCPQTSNCHDNQQADCDGGCISCPEAKDQDKDGHCDVEKACEYHSSDCAPVNRTASCHTDGVACPGTDCNNCCKEFKNTDSDGTCDKNSDCTNHDAVSYSRHAEGVHRGRGRCHVFTCLPEASE